MKLDPKRHDLAIMQLQQALESSSKTIKKNTSLINVVQQDIGKFKTVVADEVSAIFGEFEIVRADIADINVVFTNKIIATEGRIDNISGELSNYKTYVGEKFTGVEGEFEKISGDLSTYKEYAGERFTGIEANFKTIESESLKTKDLAAEVAKLGYVEADTLNAKVADLGYVTADYADLKYAAIGEFDAVKGRVGKLEGGFSDFVSGDFGSLSAGVADIKTLLFGSASGTTLTTEFANSVVSHIGTAQIESGMIKELAFDKITGFDVNTTNVTVHSKDGKSQWKDNTIQISDANRVRVQIGKDASDDYSMYVWDASGKLMFDALGLTASGIQREIIRNDMVAADAAIDGSKLNIQSVVSAIDGSTYTLSSSHLIYDGKKLDLFLGSMSETTSEHGNLLSSHGTHITAIQGQIASKIWQQDIDTAKGEMDTKYSTINQDLDAFKTSVGETYSTKSDSQTLENLINATQSDLDRAKANLSAVENRVGSTEEEIAAAQEAVDMAQKSADNAQKAADNAQADVNALTSRVSSAETSINQNSESILTLASRTEMVEGKFGDYSTTAQMNSAIEQKASGIKSEVSAIYATKTENQDTLSVANSAKTTAEQTSDKFNWIVASGTSQSDFTLTDRVAQLTAQHINLNGLVTFAGLDSAAQGKIDDAITKAGSALSAANSIDSVIANWCYENDRTVIDGGKIYVSKAFADSIFAQSINATGEITGAELDAAKRIGIGNFEFTSLDNGAMVLRYKQ